MVAISMSRQKEHLQCTEKLCNSFLDVHNKAVADLKKKVTSSRAVYSSHIEAVQNVVRLHKASSTAGLEEILSLASSNAHSIEEFFAAEAGEANSVFDDLQGSLSTHQGEMALFARELRQRFHVSIEHTKDISTFMNGFFHNLLEESTKLGSHATQTNECQRRSIAVFQRAFEEQSKSDTEKLIADMTNLVSNHMCRQKELVDARLVGLKEAALVNKVFLDGHVSSMEGMTTDAKRKWQDFSMQAENDAKDSADFSAAKHCRIELLLQQCVSTAERTCNHWKGTHESVNEMGSKHISAMASLVRSASDNNEQHDIEVDLARVAAEQDVAKNSEDILLHFDRLSEQERDSISEILTGVQDHANTLESLREDHSGQAQSISEKALETFQQRYMDYDPSGNTPTRCVLDIPSKGTIESLRAMPMESLLEEFRENHSYDSFVDKEPKPSLTSRSPLTQLN